MLINEDTCVNANKVQHKNAEDTMSGTSEKRRIFKENGIKNVTYFEVESTV